MKRLLRSICRERNSVARDRLLACCYGKEGWGIRRICEMMVRPYSTVRDWLWRMQGRGFRGRHDKKRGRRKCKMPGAMFKEVRCWLKEPSNFGFESGPRQLNLLLELIRRNFGLDCNMHMLRRWLCRIRISWRKNGHVSYRTASKRKQKEFQQKAREQTRQKCATECVVFTEDEAAVSDATES